MRKQTAMSVLMLLMLFYGQALAGNDEIQQQYLNRQFQINMDLTRAHTKYYFDSKLTGRTDEAQRKIDALEKDKADLKLDALKYYKGKLPRSFSVKWQEEETRYINDLTIIMRKARGK